MFRLIALLITSFAFLLPSIGFSQSSQKPTEASFSPEEQQQLGEAVKLNFQAQQLQRQGKFHEGILLAQRALAIREGILGPDHLDTANSLDVLALLYQSNGNYKEALPLNQRALSIHEKTLGAEHPRTCTSLNNLALLYHHQANYKAARPLYERALATQEKVLGPEHLQTTASLNNLAALYYDQGDYAKALPLYQRSLAINEKALGPDHPGLAIHLINLATLYRAQANYVEALPLYQRALSIAEKSLGPNHPLVSTNLCRLAELLREQGNYPQALPLLQRALEISEKSLGADHPSTADCANNLAEVFQRQGKFAQALPLYQRALTIREKALGPAHPQTARSLISLATLFRSEGNYAQALPLFQRALAINEKALGAEHPVLARSLNYLAQLYQDQGNYGQALVLYQRALLICEKTIGPDHLDTAPILNHLALLYDDQGDFAQALQLLERALAINEKVFGDRPDTANIINNLAMVNAHLGDLVQAEFLYQRALAIQEKLLGTDHPDTVATLYNLAWLYRCKENFAQALPLFQRGLSSMRQTIELSANLQSERQQLAMTGSFRFRLDNYLTVILDAHESAEEASTQVLAWKGAVLARQRQTRLARAARETDPELGRTFDDLQATVNHLASQSFATPNSNQRESWQQQLAELSRRKEELESELSRRSADFRHQQRQRQLTSRELQAVLPSDAALVDLLEYRHYSPPAGGKGKTQIQWRLAGIVVRPDRPIELIDLGATLPIHQAVENWRRGIGEATRDVSLGMELRRLVWQPLEKYLAGVRTVLISPDGAVAQIPFAALPGKEQGTYLIEDVAVVVVPVPQMLPGLLENVPAKEADETSLLLVGNVDFGTPADPTTELARSRSALRGNTLQWESLPATRDEVLAIQGTFARRFDSAKVTSLQKDQATEEQVRQIAPKSRYLHLATHGFFASPDLRSASDFAPNTGLPVMENSRRDVVGFHPGLLSGLVLASANQPVETGRDDGILTALEVAELNLNGVDLVTLSACETGLGKIAGGEGMLGLQRAFQVAGAKTVVSSLWKVDDAATQALMTEFYKNLWEKKLGKLEALRQAQLTMMKTYDPKAGEIRGTVGKIKSPAMPADFTAPNATGLHSSPYYWAAFVLSGDWR